MISASEYWVARWSPSSGGATLRPGGGRRRLRVWRSCIHEIRFCASLRDAPELCMKPSPRCAEFCQHLRHDRLQLWQVNRRDFPKLLVVEADDDDDDDDAPYSFAIALSVSRRA
jgi:hypothetical protein